MTTDYFALVHQITGILCSLHDTLDDARLAYHAEQANANRPSLLDWDEAPNRHIPLQIEQISASKPPKEGTKIKKRGIPQTLD